jgi:hypothetical protein
MIMDAASSSPGGIHQVPGLPLGQVLKHLELLSESQIQEALTIQRTAPARIGEILVKLGYVCAEEVELGLACQMGAEIFDVDDPVELL